jgi:toxin ParE1/3/4
LKHYQVLIIEDAEYDLSDIYQYLASHDSQESADYVLEQLESRCLSLADLPLRGHIPPELESIGVTEYREVFFKPYRIIYQIIGPKVFIHCVLDGRRDISTLLERRLLRLP